MTEKRFENRLDKNNIKFNTLNPVWDNKTKDALNVFEMIEKLNEQDVAIKELQRQNKQYCMMVNLNSDLNDEIYEQLQKTEKNYKSVLEENEQLKQFKEEVFTKIDMHLRMLPIARDNEFNEDDGDPSLYSGAIYMLETLKKELEE